MAFKRVNLNPPRPKIDNPMSLDLLSKMKKAQKNKCGRCASSLDKGLSSDRSRGRLELICMNCFKEVKPIVQTVYV